MFKNDQRTYKKRFLWASLTCWTSATLSTKLRLAWHWWPRPQAPGQPLHHWMPSLYVGCLYQPGRGEGKVMNGSRFVFFPFFTLEATTWQDNLKQEIKYWNTSRWYMLGDWHVCPLEVLCDITRAAEFQRWELQVSTLIFGSDNSSVTAYNNKTTHTMWITFKQPEAKRKRSKSAN